MKQSESYLNLLMGTNIVFLVVSGVVFVANEGRSGGNPLFGSIEPAFIASVCLLASVILSYIKVKTPAALTKVLRKISIVVILAEVILASTFVWWWTDAWSNDSGGGWF